MAFATLSAALNRRFSPTPADVHLKAEQSARVVKELWVLIACVVSAITLVRVIRATHDLAFPSRRTSPTEYDSKLEEDQPRLGGTGAVSWRRLPAAVSAGFKIVFYRWTAPMGPSSVISVSELVFICGYIVAMFAWLLIDTRNLTTWFYQDRAAHLASCQLPLIVALAGKNNVISFLTGIGHEKLNVLHRAAARTCLIFIWLHAIARVVSGLPTKFDFTHDWMIAGATGLVAFTLAAILSVRPIRHHAFEFFLVTHIVLVAVFLVCAYFHTRFTNYSTYVWPALLVWAFDRVLRLGRILWNNRIWRRNSGDSTTARIELLGHDTVRLTLRRRMTWTAGQHTYVILPTVSGLPTEAHPFTIAGIPEPLNGAKGDATRNVVFLIRARQGFTGRLRELAASGQTTVPTYIDGPYGCPPDLRRFSTCLLVAGGSGVSYTMSLLMSIIRQSNMNASRVRRVVFLWAVRDPEHISWISSTLNDALTYASPSLAVEPWIYVTRKGRTAEVATLDYGSDSPVASPIAKSEKTALPTYSAVRIFQGRPDIAQILDDEINSSSGSVSVDVAGPSAISQSIRRILRSRLSSPTSVLRGQPSVELHVETFGMVKS